MIALHQQPVGMPNLLIEPRHASLQVRYLVRRGRHKIAQLPIDIGEALAKTAASAESVAWTSRI
jgi:hypothetical protein